MHERERAHQGRTCKLSAHRQRRGCSRRCALSARRGCRALALRRQQRRFCALRVFDVSQLIFNRQLHLHDAG
jgi:hypothetical protein